MVELFGENRGIEKKADDPGLFFMETVREELKADKSIDWEEYKKSLMELLYDTVTKGDPEAIRKITLQVKRFDELRLIHKKHGVDLMEANGEE
ncbi:MAG: hypothetical protein WC848_00820 [Parcubacteria group bacterium]|jgi:hypothetical protein